MRSFDPTGDGEHRPLEPWITKQQLADHLAVSLAGSSSNSIAASHICAWAGPIATASRKSRHGCENTTARQPRAIDAVQHLDATRCARLRGPSPLFARYDCPFASVRGKLSSSGRTVRVGFLMRFLGPLRRICYGHAAFMPGALLCQTPCMPS